jgi:hypothetical protein
MRILYMVVQVTPSSIKVEIDGEIAKVFGEGYLPGYDGPSYIACTSSAYNWEPPFSGMPITPEEKRRIILEITDHFSREGNTIEFC